MMGAILGDPYTIGGNGGYPPSEPLESVFSPPVGVAPGLPLGMVPMAPKGMDRSQGWPLRTQGVHRPTVLGPPTGGPDGTPLYWGGVVL